MNDSPDRANAGQIALVDMPWDLADRPNAALGIIKSLLGNAGYSVDGFHPNVWMGERLEFKKYRAVAAGVPWVFFMEWMFSKAAFPDDFPDSTESVIRSFPEHRLAGLSSIFGPDYAQIIAELRDQWVPELCERIGEKTRDFDIVAFSCSLNQLLPGIAAARVIREYNPDVKIIIGGSQVEATMGEEVLRVAPWIDVIYKGESELALVPTIDWMLGLGDPPAEDCISYRNPDGTIYCAPNVALVQDMSILPKPDYSPYFAEIAPYVGRATNQLEFNGLPFVSSRGCWWGAKQHCTFCGLNSLGLTYRERDADVVIDEIVELCEKHRTTLLHCADNIMPHKYLKTFLPKLIERGLDLEMFYETKANLKRRDLALFRDAGMRAIQPGLESFSNHVLKLIRKGTSGIQNVYLLKLCQEAHVYPKWNLIHGFPEETDEDYTQQIEWIRLTHHLLPPESVSSFALQRFSPFHFEPENLGVTNVRPHSEYDQIFPRDRTDMDKMAFYFDFDYANGYAVAPETIRSYQEAVADWQRRWSSGARVPALTYSHGGEFLEIRDSRLPDRTEVSRVDGMYMDVMLACEDPISHRELSERFPDGNSLRQVLQELGELGFIISDEKHALNLALRAPKGASFFHMAFRWPPAH